MNSQQKETEAEKRAFIDCYGGIYEHSPWIAEGVFDQIALTGGDWRGMEQSALEQQFQAVVNNASLQEQMALLNAHPELATARARMESLTADSRREQAGARLDQCSAGEFREFGELNRAYRDRFGFPFILAVKGYGKTEILDIFRSRLANDPEQEFQEALVQVGKIAGFRLETLKTQKGQSVVRKYRNLVEPELGGAVIDVSDDFFAAAKRMLAAHEPEFHEDLYDEHGKWMDGWESRRKRCEGHDYCVIRICPGVIYGVKIDTSNFTGNYAPQASLEAAFTSGDPDSETVWNELLPKTELNGDSQLYLRVGDRREWSHLRLNIFPDGGIARLRVYGVTAEEYDFEQSENWIDLACCDHGGTTLACNDMHYGDMANLIKPGNATNMGDGWETRRRRKAGNDWVVLKLGKPGEIKRIEVDTDFFKGNNPASFSIRGCRFEGDDPVESSEDWPVILPRAALGPDQLQVFHRQIVEQGPIDHVRMDIFPDGGVARLRLFGLPVMER